MNREELRDIKLDGVVRKHSGTLNRVFLNPRTPYPHPHLQVNRRKYTGFDLEDKGEIGDFE